VTRDDGALHQSAKKVFETVELLGAAGNYVLGPWARLAGWEVMECELRVVKKRVGDGVAEVPEDGPCKSVCMVCRVPRICYELAFSLVVRLLTRPPSVQSVGWRWKREKNQEWWSGRGQTWIVGEGGWVDD
jgi:hypothetical protein